MRIAALVANLSGNSIVRSFPIVRVLQRKHDVSVIGVVPEGNVFEPYRAAFDYLTVQPRQGLLSPERTLLRIIDQIDADIIYAFKPVAWSYGAALLSRLRRHRPVILDIEDWDNLAFSVQGRLWKLRAPFTHLWSAERRLMLHDWTIDSLHHLADQKTVASEFLRNEYGGTKLPHGADPVQFNPEHYSRARARCQLGFNDKKVVLFAGTVREHKGLRELCMAVEQLKDRRCVLAVCGVLTKPLEALRREFPEHLWYLGPQPHQQMPAIWLAADLVVLPQRNDPYTQAQIPAKVFEAMAMACPIVASAVSDLPEILDGCGWLIDGDNSEELLNALRRVLSNPAEAEERGQLGRNRYLDRYSWDVMEGILDTVVADVR